MKLILLRGPVPTDRNPNEIKYSSLEKNNDIYELMAERLGDEGCEIVYWGGKYEKRYTEKCRVKWVKNLKKYRPPFEPDVVWVRGGFQECYSFIKKFKKAFILYYGAGKRYCPKQGRINLVLADSEQQAKRIRKKGYKAALWWKPAPPQFRPMNIEKKYDVCYVAAIPEDERKNCKWVYKTCPKQFKVLQLGYKPKKMKVPKNFTVKRISRDSMPKALNKCRVLIAPYTEDDSAPRVISEAMACGVPVVALDGMNMWWEKHELNHPPKKYFWNHVWLNMQRGLNYISTSFYEDYLSMDKAVEHLRGLIKWKIEIRPA
jgi:glycosyltransferase involved in cell wall biosynthesis